MIVFFVQFCLGYIIFIVVASISVDQRPKVPLLSSIFFLFDFLLKTK